MHIGEESMVDGRYAYIYICEEKNLVSHDVTSEQEDQSTIILY